MGILEVSYYYPNFISLFDHFSIGNRDINVLGCLHLELVHGLPGLRNVDLVAVLACHCKSLLFRFFRGFVRSHRLRRNGREMCGFLRERWGRMEKQQIFLR